MKPKEIGEAITDEGWIAAIEEELRQFKLNKYGN